MNYTAIFRTGHSDDWAIESRLHVVRYDKAALTEMISEHLSNGAELIDIIES